MTYTGNIFVYNPAGYRDFYRDYAMAMMYSVFNSGNPWLPKENMEVEHFMALNRKEDLQSRLSFKSDDFVIVVIGSQFSYTGIWREHALVMQATMHLMAKFNLYCENKEQSMAPKFGGEFGHLQLEERS